MLRDRCRVLIGREHQANEMRSDECGFAIDRIDIYADVKGGHLALFDTYFSTRRRVIDTATIG